MDFFRDKYSECNMQKFYVNKTEKLYMSGKNVKKMTSFDHSTWSSNAQCWDNT